MATRIEKLNRLRIATPCTESWDGMVGGAERRHCAKCAREVLDFARMTPREIEVRIAASGGRLCARITRRADGLVTLPPQEPPPFWIERRASSVASALVTALLGLGGAATGAALETSPSVALPTGPSGPLEDAGTSPDAQGAAVSKVSRIDGVVTDQEGHFLPGATVTIQEPNGGRKFVRLTHGDGRFAFENVAPGRVLITLELEGFSSITFPGIGVSAGRATRLDVQMEPQITESVTVGGIGVPSLREVVGESELVVVGIVGATLPKDPKDPAREETELRVTSVLKGRYSGRTLRVAVDRGEEEKPLAPGARVLAFLDPAEARTGGKVTYVPANGQRGPQALSDAELTVYAERIDALERISRRGGTDPEELAAWLVATIEQPYTREEETGDLSMALSSLAEIAKELGLPIEHARADLVAEAAARKADGKSFSDDEALRRAGAFITDAQKDRLVRALLATESLAQGDLDLFDVVRPWADDKAVDWLTNRFREVEPTDDGVNREVMGRLAEALASDSLKALLKESDDDLESYFASLPEGSWDHLDRVQAEMAARWKELRKRFLRML
ncbi:MAG TPA: carboxypeptidase-like regulatory domain-containing protein [Thermoanaerobaculia bacterium]|nr:carboxypeptidase-like regulatory domain-containing protein [Thermoanaerobaculia bacterium]